IESINDSHFDHCHSAIITSDWRFFNVDCEGHDPYSDPNYDWNHVTIDHGHGIKTTYGHLKKGSVAKLGLKEKQFVTCGQIIGDTGSAGISPMPPLHSQETHNGQTADPFKGKLSRQSYWVDQGTGRLPASTCQNPAELYPNRTFAAQLV